MQYIIKSIRDLYRLQIANRMKIFCDVRENSDVAKVC